MSATQRLVKEIQHLQSGDFRLDRLYVVAALVVLLIAIAVKEITMRQTLCDGYLVILR